LKIILEGGYFNEIKRKEDCNFKGSVVASICHGPWVLISANIMKGKQTTGVISLKDDLINAGAIYLDKEVVVDNNLITSRAPQDLPAFLPAIITALQNK